MAIHGSLADELHDSSSGLLDVRVFFISVLFRYLLIAFTKQILSINDLLNTRQDFD
jgi:hypothetical protein